MARNRRQRVLKIAQYLKSLDADIICLQESWDSDHRRLIQSELGSAYYALGGQLKPWPLLRRFTNTQGGLFTLSKFPITREIFKPFSRWNHSVTEMLGNKGILESIIQTPEGEMRILNTHLHAAEGLWGSWLFLGSLVRFKQFKKILDYAGEDRGVPTVLAGDFNEHAIIEQEQLVQLLHKAGFIHPSAKQEVVPTFRRENVFVDTWANRPEASQCLDYILLRSFENFAFKVIDYKPVYLKPELSDHDPIICLLSSK